MSNAELIAKDLCPMRAAILKTIGGLKPIPFHVIDREVSVRMHGVKMPDDFCGYVKLSEDPLFESYAEIADSPGDDLWGLSPLGAEVLNVIQKDTQS